MFVSTVKPRSSVNGQVNLELTPNSNYLGIIASNDVLSAQYECASFRTIAPNKQDVHHPPHPPQPQANRVQGSRPPNAIPGFVRPLRPRLKPKPPPGFSPTHKPQLTSPLLSTKQATPKLAPSSVPTAMATATLRTRPKSSRSARAGSTTRTKSTTPARSSRGGTRG
jgi:hypothetical protein